MDVFQPIWHGHMRQEGREIKVFDKGALSAWCRCEDTKALFIGKVVHEFIQSRRAMQRGCIRRSSTTGIHDQYYNIVAWREADLAQVVNRCLAGQTALNDTLLCREKVLPNRRLRHEGRLCELAHMYVG